MKRLIGNLKKILKGSKPSPPEIKSRPQPTNIPNWMQQDSQPLSHNPKEAEQISVETESSSVEIVGDNAVEDLLDDGTLNNSNVAPAEEEVAEDEPAEETEEAEAAAEEEAPADWSNGEDPWAE